MECKNCGHTVSPNAKACPKCNKDPKLSRNETMCPCKVCGKELDSSYHYYSWYSTYMENGNSAAKLVWSHRPCPNCGEPEPVPPNIRSKMKPPMSTGNFIGICIFVVICLLAISAFH